MVPRSSTLFPDRTRERFFSTSTSNSLKFLTYFHVCSVPPPSRFCFVNVLHTECSSTTVELRSPPVCKSAPGLTYQRRPASRTFQRSYDVRQPKAISALCKHRPSKDVGASPSPMDPGMQSSHRRRIQLNTNRSVPMCLPGKYARISDKGNTDVLEQKGGTSRGGNPGGGTVLSLGAAVIATQSYRPFSSVTVAPAMDLWKPICSYRYRYI